MGRGYCPLNLNKKGISLNKGINKGIYRLPDKTKLQSNYMLAIINLLFCASFSKVDQSFPEIYKIWYLSKTNNGAIPCLTLRAQITPPSSFIKNGVNTF